MSRIRVINGERYLMRDARSTKELLELWREFRIKYRSSMSFKTWLVERGKVYCKLS